MSLFCVRQGTNFNVFQMWIFSFPNSICSGAVFSPLSGLRTFVEGHLTTCEGLFLTSLFCPIGLYVYLYAYTTLKKKITVAIPPPQNCLAIRDIAFKKLTSFVAYSCLCCLDLLQCLAYNSYLEKISSITAVSPLCTEFVCELDSLLKG